MTAPPTAPEAEEASAYQLRIDLQHFNPPIWRRLVVPAAYSFQDLHEVIQIAFDWDESHLHEFKLNNLRIGNPFFYDEPLSSSDGPDLEDETKVRLQDVGLTQGQTFTYTYDFGDNWHHKIKVEEILRKDAGKYLPVCLDGRRAAPLEESGSGPMEGMFEGDPEHFDPYEVDDRLEMSRIQWAERNMAIPKPAEVMETPEHLYWVVQERNLCVRCDQAMHVGRFEVTLHASGKDSVPVQLMGHHCGSCNALHAQLQRLVESLDGTGRSLSEIEGFAWGGQNVPASLAYEEKEPRTQGSKQMAWEKFAQLYDDPHAPPPSNEQIAALPVEQTTWIAETRPIRWSEAEDGSLALVYLTMLIDQDQEVRRVRETSGAPPAEGELTDFLKKALATPVPHLEPGRPTRLELGPRFEAAQSQVAARLQGTGIEVEVGLAVDADAAFDSFGRFMERPGAPPVLLGKDPSEVLAFLEAGERFLDAQPWHHMEPDVFLGIRLDDEPERPLTVMGHMGEEFGYLVLDSWEDTKGFMEDIDKIDAWPLTILLGPMGKPQAASESVTLTDITFLHPLDGEYLESHGLLNPDEAELMIPRSYGPQGPRVPEIPLEDHNRILQALTRLLPQEHGEETRSTTVDEKRVTIRIVQEIEEPPGPRA